MPISVQYFCIVLLGFLIDYFGSCTSRFMAVIGSVFSVRLMAEVTLFLNTTLVSEWKYIYKILSGLGIHLLYAFLLYTDKKYTIRLIILQVLG